MNIENIAKFEKVSFEQYLKDYMETTGKKETDSDFESTFKNEVFEIWKNIKLPQRATYGSAGYDFYMPVDVPVSETSMLIPTGIRAKIQDGWVLMIFPRSGYGTKYGMHLDNTVGIIDSDYYFAQNEGHIMAKISSNKSFGISKGDRFIQGVFLPFGLSINGNSNIARIGGLGSTGTK